MGSLRTYFGKEVGKERNSKITGTGRKEVYTSKWPFFKSLQFLRDNITPRKTTSNMDPIIIADEMSESGTSNSNLGVDEVENTPPPDVESCVFNINNPPSSKSKRKKAAELEEELLTTCLQELKKPRNEPVPRPEDADSAFGNYVAKQLKKIPEGYDKEMMKIEIQNAIVKTMMTASCTSRQANQSALTTIDFNDLNSFN